MKKILKQVLLKINLMLSKAMSTSPITASFYYFACSNKFRREHQSVLKARLKYYAVQHESEFRLRRNVHRLEKGLTMKNRRGSFALDYIDETICSYCNLSIVDENENSAKWYTDVLKEYFASVEESPGILKLKNKFENSDNLNYFQNKSEQTSVKLDKKKPFEYGQRSSQTSYQELLSLAKARHSVRWYTDKIVSKEDVDDCITLASCAPSACNRQPFKFIVLQGNKVASEVAGFAMGTGGFAQNIPNLIAVVGDLSAYPFERDRHVIYIDSSLSSMLLMLAFKSKGIDSCPINWPDIESRERKIEKYLGLERHERVVMLMAFGYGEEGNLIPYSEKKSFTELSEFKK